MAFMGDLFPTILKLCGIELPEGVVLDGRGIWELMKEPNTESPHEAIFALRGSKLSTVRSGRWKLHVLSPGPISSRSDYWQDPLGPDGVTILAPFEQARPRDYPGAVGGDEPTEMMLFDLYTDPAEKENVASQYPDIVKKLLDMHSEMNTQIPELTPPIRDPHESLENRLKRPRPER
jgi:arylsulfatase A-like enzyme